MTIRIHDHGVPKSAAATAMREAAIGLNAALRASGQKFVYVLAVVPLDADGRPCDALMGSNLPPEDAQGLLTLLAHGRSAAAADESGVAQ